MIRSSRNPSSFTSCVGVSGHGGPLVRSLRTFYSGFDDTRVSRLRKTNALFNKPRGRDAASEAFERRIDLKPMWSVGDLYAGLDDQSLGSTALVLPVSSGAEVERSISLPSTCRFQYYESLFPRKNSQQELTSSHDAADSLLVAVNEDIGGPQYPQDMKRFLRNNGDTYSVALPTTGTPTASSASPTSSTAAAHDLGGGLLVLVVNPVLDHKDYQRSEAEVEMISAYRNILSEITDWSMGVPLPFEAAALAGRRAVATRRRRLTTLRVPVLSVDTETPALRQQLAKMTQAALIKAFHRIAPRSKEHLLFSSSAVLTEKNSAAIRPEAATVKEADGSDFRIELFVPPELLQEYQQSFLTEAWAPMKSVFLPPRLDLYAGTPPPEQLAVMDGWVGNRPELLEAIRTKGKSLEGVQYGLDGKVIEPFDVMANINPLKQGEVARQIAANEEKVLADAASTVKV
ncbi:Hypothetical protein, putative [Bodo saltans]|uniref:Uncharacterized protein n=1 Tax=Bodo saltans TaxID=75058 RepID=A0A0S4JNY8_BODSA|nr:Hypothetical protein, putative [Bodo saltans]|eukprot:CUG92364.1 Hypothetical protein, putative [Bodo saltans]